VLLPKTKEVTLHLYLLQEMLGSSRPIVIQTGGGGGRRRSYRKSYKKKKKPSAQSKGLKRLMRDYPLSRYAYVPQARNLFAKDSAEWGGTANGYSYKTATPQQQAHRTATGYFGKGLYGGQGGYVSNALSSFAKKQRIGAALGSVARGAIGRLGSVIGSGAYENALFSSGAAQTKINGANDETDTIVISDTEFVKDIYAPTIVSGSSAYAQQRIAINPGLFNVMPNMSQFALNYTEWKVHQLIFSLHPVISENNVNNGQAGIAMMTFAYDITQDDINNKSDLMSSYAPVSGRITEDIVLGVECDEDKTKSTTFYVRTGPVPTGKDPTEYDMGYLVIATNNIPAAFSNQQLFELKVAYTIELRKKRSGALKLANQRRDVFVCSGDLLISPTTICPYQQFVAGPNGVMAAQQNNLGGRLSSAVPGLGGNWTYTFLPEVSGLFEFRLTMEFTTGILIGDVVLIGLGGIGSVTPWKDIYGVASAGDSPEYYNVLVDTNGRVCVFGRFNVQSVSGSTNNQIVLNLMFNVRTITQWQFEVTEFTGAFRQDRARAFPEFKNIVDGITYPV